MRARQGFTLVEVMVALVILMVVLVSFAAATGRLLHTVVMSDRREAAMRLVADRLELIRMEPSYARLDSLYPGIEANFSTLPGFTRTTVIVRAGGVGQPVDYKKITVTVSGPGLLVPESRTVTVAAP